MFPHWLKCAVFCLLVLLATGNAARGMIAGQTVPDRFNPGRHLYPVHGISWRHAVRSSRLMIDDGATHLFGGLQLLGILPDTTLLPATTFLPMVSTGRDLLSLTQQRRE